jgi:hypothetical protein
MTSRLLVPTVGLLDWQRLLCNPQKQWRKGRSAYELAVAWETARHTARGLPRDVADVLDRSPDLRDAQLLLAVPEHQVVLDGGGHQSQTDLWGLLRTPAGLVSIAVEAKAGEGFDKQVAAWLRDATPQSGKPERLEQLCRVLNIDERQARGCRYQLLHRTAAAILEAKRFGIARALLLVQSFCPDARAVRDYCAFGDRLGVALAENAVVSAGHRDGVDLWLAWVASSPEADQALSDALA